MAFKIIFIFMLLFLALASLTALNYLLMNQYITEHRDTFSLTKKIKEQCFGEFYPHNRIANKRAKMALNHSPEFKSSNPKASAAQLFGILRPPFEQTSKNSAMQCRIPNFKHLSEVVLKQKIVFISSYVLLMFEHRTPLVWGHFGPGTLV